jgi:hypothetical protein
MHNESCECSKSELDLFSMPPTMTSMDSGRYIQYNPVSTISDNGPIEFLIESNEQFIDINDTALHVQAKIVKADGSAPDAGTANVMAPVNLWLHSLFSQVDLVLGSERITSSTDMYPYRAILETMLNFDQNAKENKLTNEMYYDETGGGETITQDWCEVKLARTNAGQTVDMMGRLHTDLFHQGRYLLPKSVLKIALTRSKPEFSLMVAKGGPFKIIIERARLYVRHVEVNASERNVIETQLNTTNARYPVRRVLVTNFNIPSGMKTYTKDNLYIGGSQIPKRLILAMVRNDAFKGDLKKNPFNFAHFDINKLEIFANGRSVLGQALEPDFSTKQIGRTYHHMLQSLGKGFGSTDDLGISIDEFCDGKVLFVFDLTPDQGADAVHRHLAHSGSLRIDMGFETAPTHPITVILFGEFDNTIEVTKTRETVLDY